MTKQGRPVVHTRAALLECALRIAQSQGYTKLTRLQLARAAGVSEGQISNVFGSMKQLRIAIIQTAIEKKNLVIIAQGIAAGDKKTSLLPLNIKRQALEQML
jgi:AcrR family transcriptional regulator